jgi:RNA polymerase-binding transcription factor DksA
MTQSQQKELTRQALHRRKRVEEGRCIQCGAEIPEPEPPARKLTACLPCRVKASRRRRVPGSTTEYRQGVPGRPRKGGDQ